MKREFVPYEQALELKQLGFNEPCFGFYDENLYFPNNESIYGTFCNQILDSSSCSAPTYSQAFRWFREKYELSSWIYNSNLDKYFYTILMNGRIVKANEQSTTYEEAELECLKKLIEITKNK